MRIALAFSSSLPRNFYLLILLLSDSPSTKFLTIPPFQNVSSQKFLSLLNPPQDSLIFCNFFSFPVLKGTNSRSDVYPFEMIVPRKVG